MQNKIIDKVLILNVIKGSETHQRKFIKIAEKIVYGALSSFNQFDQQDKEDLLQNVFLKLFKDDMRRIKMWNEKAKFSTYLYMIASNSALDYLDSKHFKRKLLSNSLVDIDSVKSTINNNPNKVIDKISLGMCVDKLRPIEKEIISLYYKNGFKEKEIAEKLDVSINTISSIKSRAIKKIRKNITKEFWV
jgi:RNA polymerase sigma-70 factor (ECF subfamily)